MCLSSTRTHTVFKCCFAILNQHCEYEATKVNLIPRALAYRNGLTAFQESDGFKQLNNYNDTLIDMMADDDYQCYEMGEVIDCGLGSLMDCFEYHIAFHAQNVVGETTAAKTVPI